MYHVLVHTHEEYKEEKAEKTLNYYVKSSE